MKAIHKACCETADALRHARQLRQRREHRRLPEGRRRDDGPGAGLTAHDVRPDIRPMRAGVAVRIRGCRLPGPDALPRHDILLVASLYDSFILDEDGQLSERVLGRVPQPRTCTTAPGLTPRRRPAPRRSRSRAAERRFNLVIAALQLGDMDVAELARRLREQGLRHAGRRCWPTTRASCTASSARADASAIERVFLWQGDARILLGDRQVRRGSR